VPRVLVNGAALRRNRQTMLAERALAVDRRRRRAARDFFVRTLGDHIDDAPIAATWPSPKRPLTVSSGRASA